MGTGGTGGAVPTGPAILVSPTEGVEVSEAAGTATVEVVLGAPPTADVGISLSSSDETAAVLDVFELIFTPGNWNVPQRITITGVDDPIDDDAASIVVTPTGGLTTAETGSSALFTVALGCQPLGMVTVPVAVSDDTEATVIPTSLTFGPDSWDTPQTVIVQGLDDTLTDGDLVYLLTLGPAVSTDAAYNATRQRRSRSPTWTTTRQDSSLRRRLAS
jgi:hypothetical protein